MTRTAPSPWVTWLALLAFLLQGLVAQTHVHTSADAALSVPAHHNNQPAPKAPADCPACQIQAAASAVVMPHAVITFLPLGWVENIALVLTAAAATPRAHQGWQSRAPPQR
jgi:hypothetical protein